MTIFAATILAGAAIVTASNAIVLDVASEAEETPEEIISAKLRSQGFECAKAEDATKDERESRPDAPVWVLRCSNAAYWIRLKPGMAAEVRRLD